MRLCLTRTLRKGVLARETQPMTHFVSLQELASRIPSGAKMAVPADYAGVAMAATRPLIESGTQNLHLVCIPTGGLQVDLLIGAHGLARGVVDR